MPITEQDRTTVEGVFRAMQMGPSGETLMMSLFAEDAVFIESFTGQERTHRGSDEIRQAFLEAVSQPGPDDFQLHLDRLDLEGSSLRAQFRCTSAAFPSPMRGYDLFDIRDGKIHRLEVVLTEFSGMP